MFPILIKKPYQFSKLQANYDVKFNRSETRTVERQIFMVMDEINRRWKGSQTRILKFAFLSYLSITPSSGIMVSY